MAPAVVLTVVVTGCSGGGDSSAPSKLPAAGTAAPSATPTPPPSPSPQAEVEAAVRRYYDAVNMAISNGDTSGLATMSVPSCTCRKLIDTVNDVYSKGRSEGARFNVGSISLQEIQGETAAAEIKYESTAYVVLDKAGNVLERLASSYIEALVSLVKEGSLWRIQSIVQLNVGDQ
jgi:uncharacterized membrane protein